MDHNVFKLSCFMKAKMGCDELWSIFGLEKYNWRQENFGKWSSLITYLQVRLLKHSYLVLLKYSNMILPLTWMVNSTIIVISKTQHSCKEGLSRHYISEILNNYSPHNGLISWTSNTRYVVSLSLNFWWNCLTSSVYSFDEAVGAFVSPI